jgi:hypothetical protein
MRLRSSMYNVYLFMGYLLALFFGLVLLCYPALSPSPIQNQ